MTKRNPAQLPDAAPDALLAAAVRHESVGDLEKAAALLLRAGAPLRAAGIHFRRRSYLEAARIFRAEGQHLRAAQALERHGDRAAAAREYLAAGNHARAARLFEEARLYAEAAEAYRPLLGGEEVTPRSAGWHTTYAALLALAGERERAAAVYRAILAAVPGHLRAASGLQSLSVRAPLRPLRSALRSGRMEPRLAMRLWVQAMRALAERHAADVVFGCLTPESITVDGEDAVLLEASSDRRAPYASPQMRAGAPPARQDDIYSLGVILFELVTGGTAGFGRRRAAAAAPDVPQWLDELIERCTARDPARRYRTTEEVSAAILKLKKAAAE